jgi:hypothetical protein
MGANYSVNYYVVWSNNLDSCLEGCGVDGLIYSLGESFIDQVRINKGESKMLKAEFLLEKPKNNSDTCDLPQPSFVAETLPKPYLCPTL